MNTIELSRFGILALDHDGVSVTFSAITSGTWRIVRRDDWQHEDRVVNALRQLDARPGVDLIDPTGLLGGSRYGYDADRTPTPAPVSTAAPTTRKRRSANFGYTARNR